MSQGHTTTPRALPGMAVAAVTAVVSGVSVFVNSQGVHAISPPAVYTTAKNLVATLVLGAVAAVALRRRGRGGAVLHRWVAPPSGPWPARPADRGRHGIMWWLGLAYVGLVGGGVAFILFFDGLADTTATPAAFLHDGLVVWVAIAAVPLLRERLRAGNVVVIVFLMGGQVAVLGGVGHLAASRGETLVLVATWLWAVEVVVCKRLLAELAPAAISLARMGTGSIVLLGYLVLSGDMGVLGSLSVTQLGWAGATGLLLAAYVGTWMTALARARAVDVTSVLVGSTVITGILSAMAGTSPVGPAIAGFVLIAVGVVLQVAVSTRPAAT